MKKWQWHFQWWPAALMICLTGCAAFRPVHDEVHHYILTSTAGTKPASLPKHGIIIRLRPVEVARYLKGGDIAVRLGVSEINYPIDDRWAEPLEAGIRRVVGENLTASAPKAQILTDQPTPQGQVVNTIVIQVLTCEGREEKAGGGSIDFKAEWRIESPGLVQHGLFQAPGQSWAAGHYDQLASGLSKDLRQFTDVLLNALETSAK